jgi:hypothetical protein
MEPAQGELHRSKGIEVRRRKRSNARVRGGVSGRFIHAKRVSLRRLVEANNARCRVRPVEQHLHQNRIYDPDTAKSLLKEPMLGKTAKQHPMDKWLTFRRKAIPPGATLAFLLLGVEVVYAAGAGGGNLPPDESPYALIEPQTVAPSSTPAPTDAPSTRARRNSGTWRLRLPSRTKVQ